MNEGAQELHALHCAPKDLLLNESFFEYSIFLFHPPMF